MKVSEHYRKREYAGCTGCVAVALVVVATGAMALWAVVEAVRWLLSLVG